jgi:Putative tail fiber protein gp53-like, C-terminal
MANLADNPEFTANEVYEIQATDSVEGAASGASFNGLGVSNAPHQQLANRTAFLKGRQDTNIANIAALQAFQVLFAGLMAGNGYVKIPFVDMNRGLITAIVQWGGYFPSGKLSQDASWQVTWPTAFPNACVFALASLSNTTADKSCGKLVMETVGFTTTSGTFMSDYIGGASTGQDPNDGFYWVAIGF